MTMVAQWQYPGSQMNGATISDAATTDGAGERILQSIQYKAVLTTKDPMPKVNDVETGGRRAVGGQPVASSQVYVPLAALVTEIRPADSQMAVAGGDADFPGRQSGRARRGEHQLAGKAV